MSAKEAQTSTGKEEANAAHERVSKEDCRSCKLSQGKLCGIVVGRVEEDIDGASARCEVASPPPLVVLSTELKVGQHDCDLGTCDAKDDEDDEEKPKDVVVLVQPERRQDEKQLHKNDSEGKDASDCRCDDWMHVPNLRRNLPRELDGGRRVFRDLSTVANVGAKEAKRKRCRTTAPSWPA